VVALSWMVLALTGCGDDRACGMEMELDEPIADECLGTCGRVLGPRNTDFVISSEALGPMYKGHIDSSGEAEFCLEQLYPPGEYELFTAAPDATCDTPSTTLEIRPFGWGWGLDKPFEMLTELPWVPEVVGLDDPPVLEPDPEGWDSRVVSMPSVTTYQGRKLLYYSGRNRAEYYGLGVAEEQPDGSFERLTEASMFHFDQIGSVEDDWNYFSQNTPEIVNRDDEELWLYYNGDVLNNRLSIGAAYSTDGVDFTQHADNPLFDINDIVRAEERGNSVAHASIVQRDGVYEMWFATGTLWLGYALSTDGEEWTPYCELPVFEGLGTWDLGKVKAPEVIYEDGLYWMTFSGCDKGCYQVGWAVSADGIRWVAHPDPIIPFTGDGSWNSVATQGAEIERDGDIWRFWYAGSDGDTTSIGVVEAQRP